MSLLQVKQPRSLKDLRHLFSSRQGYREMLGHISPLTRLVNSIMTIFNGSHLASQVEPSMKYTATDAKPRLKDLVKVN